MVPANIVEAAANTKLLALVFFSVLFGFFLARIAQPHQGTVMGFWQGIFQIMMRMTGLVMMLAPIGVFALIAKVVAISGFEGAGPLLLFAGCVVGGLALYGFVALPILLAIVARVNPWRLYPAMAPALLTAFSTASSSATLPLSLECLEKRAKVSERIAGFVMPLGASVNHAGSALYECAAAMFIAQAYGLHLSFATQFTVVILALITSMGIAGIPAASLVGIAIILAAVGLPAEAIGVLLVFDRLLDMCRTAINVLADAACTVIVARLEGETGVLPAPEPQKRRQSRQFLANGACPHSAFAGFLRKAHAHRAESAIDVEDLAGDAVGEIRAQERGGIAHVFERDIAAQRRDFGDAAQHLAEAGDAGGGERLDGTGGNAVHADVVRTHVRGQEAHVGLEAGLGEAHDVVARDGLHGAEIGQREDRAGAARHERLARRAPAR